MNTVIEHTLITCTCTGKLCKFCNNVLCQKKFDKDNTKKDKLYSRCKNCKYKTKKVIIYNIEHVTQDCKCTGKICNSCEHALCIGDYYKTVEGYLQGDCKKCFYDRRIQYVKNNRDDYKLSNLVYRTNNLNKFRIYEHKRRALKKQTISTVTLEQWEKLKQKYNHTCLSCGKVEPDIKLELDHIVPLSKHGTNDISNIQPLCKSCNSSKGTKTIDYRNL
jgi:5-methylcytosine-specific restriction endonuclease McrA